MISSVPIVALLLARAFDQVVLVDGLDKYSMSSAVSLFLLPF
jgi:hypothetical protein